ncbi:MAG: peptidylprolyl isomerase [Bacteroidales bacterium]|jgi:FKBP-type peptidyl-prolyl cis-trans isomerase SlyD|nr:peptidylprolyl isomerase [Bacteroidales bacterium]MDY0255175.1 peptidylprolyl isomerase [Tenuifilaceae bacterium]
MNVSKDKVVSVSYELKVDGEIVDKAEVESPMQFIYGNGTLIPSFENNIKDMTAGDSFDFSIPADQAYGQVMSEYILKLPIDIFEREGKVDEGLLQVGARLPMVDQEGNQLNGLVMDVKEDHVVMDFNHPLAGQDLHFTGKVEEVRDASAEELTHGHVHSHKHDEGHDCGC